MENLDFGDETLAVLTRNNMVESVHAGHFVMLNADGSIYKSKGNPDLPIYPRSAVKSLQASAMVRNGLKLPPRLLALVCASHSGSSMHQDAALEILDSAGLAESDLQNSFDKPLGIREREAWGDKPATRLAMNCSGKHSGMLATCFANGWSINDYLSDTHPLQQAIIKEFEELSGEKILTQTVDGCGAPLFAISTLGLAQAIYRLTLSDDPVHQEVVAACRAFPEMVAGEERLTTKLMREVPGLFMKEGAEAVEVASLADGRTVVFKISDGSNRAFPAIIQAVLNEWGVHAEIEQVEIKGGGKPVGSIIATI